ncbi:translation initiation factor IF-2 [uncultured Bacteroides sp.]|uniref:translation initiation factor IF-2 n=1 Tax=uncultured Bacteroides sp. TaxID=162156 RepID=UPI0025E4FCF0|nr:translation initiation factor IF-2 [uncultured Bacteroides sp.]
MTIRLNKVTRDLNVGITTVVEFLQKKGHAIEANPNTKITDEQYDLLVKEFSTDKDLKLKTERFIQERQSKERNKASVAIDGYDKEAQEKPKAEEVVKAVIPEDVRPKFKPVGKIDLDKLNRKHTVEKEKEAEPEQKVVEEIKAEEPAPVVEAPKPEPVPEPQPEPAPVVETAPVVEEEPAPVASEPVSVPKEESTPVAAEAPGTEDKEEIFKIHQPEFVSKINVIGQIDLAALNQSTRPKKKSKEEKRKEREEKEKQRQDQKKLMKEAIIKEIRRDDGKMKDLKDGNDANAKKKRVRINKEKVDINNASNFQRGGNDRPKGGGQQGGNNQQGGKNKDRFKKPVIKQEVSEEDVAKQVKETLARLTSKGKNKGAKYRKEKRDLASNRMQELENQEMAESKILKLTEFVTANELASMMDISVTQVIATCMSIGMMVSINQRLDAETINLVAEEFGFKTEYVSAEVAQAIVEEEDAEEDLQPRAPIVTVMGHVDHGKTSLLDYIRKANVIAGEAGGITQHIGAYHVTLEDGRKITFLDTPGHEAFTAMRARGAKATDIAIIIVAADDNVMPQTKEAINHAMAAGVPIVFAINKIDKPTANPDKIKEELAAMNFLVEEWGGKYQSQDISAKKGIGVSDLMEKVLLEAEMLDLKANPDRRATGSIIESSLDKGRGYVATVLVSNGTLKMGDIVLAGTSYGKVKAMFNERNQRMKEAGPSEPALILGLNGAPAAGDTFHVIETEQEAREIANKREQLQREQGLRTQKMLTLDEVGRRLALGDFHELNIIVKGDVDGSVEALSDSLIKLSTEQVQVNVIHKGVGQISESDVSLAAASDAIIVGFQVRPSGAAAKLAEQEGVDIRKYSVIYDAIEEVKAAMEGMLAPTLKEQVTATIEVREVFNITKVGLVAGAMVKTGKVKRSDKARLIRDGIVVFTGNINALKRFKDDVKEVGTNFECGISLTNCNDIKVGDIIESYEEVEVKQTL